MPSRASPRTGRLREDEGRVRGDDGSAERDVFEQRQKHDDYGLKVLEISNANAASAIDFFVSLMGSKSVSDVFTLSASQARKTFDDASGQNKE